MTTTNIKSKVTAIDEEWHAANRARGALYRWFADVFARELSSATLKDWSSNQAYNSIHEAFISLDLESYSSRVKSAIASLNELPAEERALELAADFAQIFLLSGDDSAPPYASYYLHEDKHLYGETAGQMRRFLDSQKLKLSPDFREPDDHISVYFMVMSLWINNSIAQNLDSQAIAEEQIEFLDTALLSWLPKFDNHCQEIRVETDLYPALTALATQFVLADREALATVIS